MRRWTTTPTCGGALSRASQRKLCGNHILQPTNARMTAQNQHLPRLRIRDLFVITTVSAILLAAAAQYRNGIWLVLVPGSFYLPYLLLCTLVTRRGTLISSVIVLHTVAVLMWPLAMKLAYGVVDEIPLLAAIAIIDVPLLPIYLALDVHPYVALPISIVIGGPTYAAIAYALFRGRRRSNGAKKVSETDY
jgi:hypothetical protein